MNIGDLTAEQKAFYDRMAEYRQHRVFRNEGLESRRRRHGHDGYLIDTAEKIADLKAQWEGFETESRIRFAAFPIKESAIVTAEIRGMDDV